MYGGIPMYRGHMDAPYADNSLLHMPAYDVGKTSLFKTKFLHLKRLKFS